MEVSNLLSPRTGNPVANQFHITDYKNEVFQSYNSKICKISRPERIIYIYPDRDHSRTTKKYFKQFIEKIWFNYDEIKKKLDKWEKEFKTKKISNWLDYNVHIV